MTAKIKFGTDGWRGRIAEDFTFENVRICAQAIANYLKKAGSTEGGVVIGYDTRFASEEFAAATAEVIAGNGIRVRLCPKPTPTPVLSYAVTISKAAGGIMITASHNPFMWNGFKFKTKEGVSASREIYAEVEKEAAKLTSSGIWKQLPLTEAVNKGVVDYWDPVPAYIKGVEKLVDLPSLRNSTFRVIVDTMYGTGAGYLPNLLQGGKIRVSEINSERNPLFPDIQPEPIAKNLSRLIGLVKEQKADVGLATDGDADRIGIVDEKGEFFNTQQVFGLICLYFLEVRGERGPIVKTVSSTDMLYRLGELYSVPVYETAVGFPYVAQEMFKRKAIIGGEESGGYAYGPHLRERDGILAGLYFLDFMLKKDKTPSQLLDYLYSKVGPHYYDRLDFPFSSDRHQVVLAQLTKSPPEIIAGREVDKIDTTDGFRFFLVDGSWLLVRFSGTEPLVRLYAEASSQTQVKELLDDGKKLLGL